MSSYYNRVSGSLSAAEIARSEDIHLIQSNIQAAFQQMMNDIFGTGCILGGEEEDLKLTPIPDHIDQSNTNYDPEDQWFSFYDVYLSQSFEIEKSEINTIRVTMKNNTKVEPTVFAEIRDADFNLVKETNIQLSSTLENENGINVDFVFNLEHLPLGEYYFVIRPVDVNINDLTTNGDENSQFDYIDPDQISVLYDNNGNYNQGLYVSYNGVDYLESRLLEANVIDDIIEVSSTNYDLCFEQIFSVGNTYVINPAPCIVLGEKVYPIDTHVTIDGPSTQGDRVDLVSLFPDGTLNVTKGEAFLGPKTEANYPTVDIGFKIAYITTYANGDTEWSCPSCGHVNSSNIETCPICDTATNTKIPLIEQGDDGTYTRQRDFLERIRRLEKKMSYQIENNSPSRIKYTCEVDPILAYSSSDLKSADGDFLVIAEDTYNMVTKTNDKGQLVVETGGTNNTTYKWSIVDKKSEYDYTEKKTTNAKLTGWDVHMPLKKPKSIKKDLMFFNATVTTKRSTEPSTTKTTIKKDTNQSGKSTTTTTTETWYGVANLKLKITIKDKNKKVIKTLNDVVTNKKGAISINLWEAIPKLKAGTYKITTQYGNEKITNTVKVYSGKINKNTSKSTDTNLKLNEKQVLSTTYNVDDNTFTGKSHYYTENITLDVEDGIACLKAANTKTDYKKVDTIPEEKRKTAKSANYKYTIKPNSQSLQSEYCLCNVEFKKDCTIQWITPFIKSFKNIKTFGIILFKNDQIFDVNYNRKTYTKLLSTKKADKTLFPNIYKDKWTVEGTKSDGVITPNSQHVFKPKKPLQLTAGVYSILLWGKLKDPKKEGWIQIKEYTTSKASKYGAISRVKGTSNPAKIYIEKNGLINKTMKIRFKKYDKTYKSSGTLISKTINTKEDIKACTFNCSSNIPNGTRLHMYVSNNGGKTYIETEGGTVNFNGAGHELKWKIDFTGNATKGNSTISPKIFFNKNGKYAVKIKATTIKTYIGYEDYGRCYSTPILNANAITRTLVDNSNVESSFSEWEYARLWMEMEDLSDVQQDAMVKTDICIAHEYDEYDVNVGTKLTNAKGKIFFSQIFANLVPSDFSNTSVDYSNYDANVEPDELNYRFKLQSEKMEHYTGGVIAAAPYDPGTYERDYFYGDINIEGIDTSSFAYGLCKMDDIYVDNDGNPTKRYSGMHIVSAPYYQVKYNHQLSILNDEDPKPTNTEGSEGGETPTAEPTQTTETKPSVWASDSDTNYNPDTILIGVSFDNGLEITDNFTDLYVDIIPNLGEFKEDKDGVIQIDTNGQPILKESFQPDTTKYYYEDQQRYYIPANTLEVVVALNKYGQIEDNNATYGKAYPITYSLISGKHQNVKIPLDELYGSTIYSIGIRVSTKKDSDGNYIIQEQDDNKHPSLHDGDCLGLGNISFGGYNRFPYVPYIYTGLTNRWSWKALNPQFQSTAYALCNVNEGSGKYLPYKIAGPGNKTNESDNYQLYSRQHYPAVYFKSDTDNISYSSIKQEKHRISFTHPNGTKYISGDSANSILFDFAPATSGKTELGNMFQIDTDIRLAPYDFVDVAYYVLQEYPNDDRNGQIYKGEIVLRLYDTTDITGATPIEELPLPAWGAIQNAYGIKAGDETKPKIVHAWFKLHNKVDKIKSIVIHRANPTNRTVDDLKLVLNNILFYNTETMPALGPQMQLRIYPNTMNNLANTKIRKYGCIYRI